MRDGGIRDEDDVATARRKEMPHVHLSATLAYNDSITLSFRHDSKSC